MIEAFVRSCPINNPASACPASCHATSSTLSFSPFFFKCPSISCFIHASSRISRVMIPLFFLVAMIAASFNTVLIVAGLLPIVSFAKLSMSTSSANFLLPAYKLMMIFLSFAVAGRLTAKWLSNLPGLVSAGSRSSIRFVAAITTTPPLPSKPSISESSVFKVCLS